MDLQLFEMLQVKVSQYGVDFMLFFFYGFKGNIQNLDNFVNKNNTSEMIFIDVQCPVSVFTAKLNEFFG